jgi:CspA family cold shock protein
MLKRITKFVLERRKTVQKPRPQVVENHDTTDPASVSESPTQAAEPQLDEPSSQLVWAKVKWYNPDKRYGFVELADGSGDAFLHATTLVGIGVNTLQPGETLELRVALGQRGPQVEEVTSVDSSTAAPSRPSRTRVGSASDPRSLEASVQEMGTVKWYNATKGFGFVVRDTGGKDVFLRASVLQRAGITRLNVGERVFVGVVEGRRGPEAASIQVASGSMAPSNRV